jgi:hypothetical protein
MSFRVHAVLTHLALGDTSGAELMSFEDDRGGLFLSWIDAVPLGRAGALAGGGEVCLTATGFGRVEVRDGDLCCGIGKAPGCKKDIVIGALPPLNWDR